MLKPLDVLLNNICIEFGDKKLAQHIQTKRASELERLLIDYEFSIKNSADDVQKIMKEFNRLFTELNELLSYSQFSIHRKALQELLEYSVKYNGQKALSKSLDTIFSLANEQRSKPRYEWISQNKQRIGEIRIHNERWRVYFTGSDKKIIGFDYEHKTNNHRDIIPKLLKRISS